MNDLTDKQRAMAATLEDWAAERRRQRREYMADWRASNPEAEARRKAKQNTRRRADRARHSNRDLIGG